MEKEEARSICVYQKTMKNIKLIFSDLINLCKKREMMLHSVKKEIGKRDHFQDTNIHQLPQFQICKCYNYVEGNQKNLNDQEKPQDTYETTEILVYDHTPIKD